MMIRLAICPSQTPRAASEKSRDEQ